MSLLPTPISILFSPSGTLNRCKRELFNLSSSNFSFIFSFPLLYCHFITGFTHSLLNCVQYTVSLDLNFYFQNSPHTSNLFSVHLFLIHKYQLVFCCLTLFMVMGHSSKCTSLKISGSVFNKIPWAMLFLLPCLFAWIMTLEVDLCMCFISSLF